MKPTKHLASPEQHTPTIRDSDASSDKALTIGNDSTVTRSKLPHALHIPSHPTLIVAKFLLWGHTRNRNTSYPSIDADRRPFGLGYTTAAFLAPVRLP